MPLPTVTSPRSNPVTDSEKVIVTAKAPVCMDDGPLMITVGDNRSACTEYRLAAVLPRSPRSWAAPAATSTVTVPVADGVMVAV